MKYQKLAEHVRTVLVRDPHRLGLDVVLGTLDGTHVPNPVGDFRLKEFRPARLREQRTALQGALSNMPGTWQDRAAGVEAGLAILGDDPKNDVIYESDGGSTLKMRTFANVGADTSLGMATETHLRHGLMTYWTGRDDLLPFVRLGTVSGFVAVETVDDAADQWARANLPTTFALRCGEVRWRIFRSPAIGSDIDATETRTHDGAKDKQSSVTVRKWAGRERCQTRDVAEGVRLLGDNELVPVWGNISADGESVRLAGSLPALDADGFRRLVPHWEWRFAGLDSAPMQSERETIAREHWTIQRMREILGAVEATKPRPNDPAVIEAFRSILELRPSDDALRQLATDWAASRGVYWSVEDIDAIIASARLPATKDEPAPAKRKARVTT